MGAWDVGIFDNDTSVDVRGIYEHALLEDEATATQRVLARFADDLAEPECAPDVWLGLAGAQWELGRPEPEVVRRALAVIDDGRDLERWRDLDASEESLSGRAEALAAFRARLSADPPPLRLPERPPERRPLPSTRFSVGDVLAYRLPSGRWIPLTVIQVARTFTSGAAPVCAFFPRSYPTPPSFDEVMTLDVAEDPFRTQEMYVSPLEDWPVPIGDVPPEVTLRAHMLWLVHDDEDDGAHERAHVQLLGRVEINFFLVGHLERLGWSELAPYLARHVSPS